MFSFKLICFLAVYTQAIFLQKLIRCNVGIADNTRTLSIPFAVSSLCRILHNHI